MQSQMNSPATSPTGSPARSPRTSLLMRKADEAKHMSGGGGSYGDPAGDNVGESFDADGVGRGVMSVAPSNAEIQAVVQAGRNGGGGIVGILGFVATSIHLIRPRRVIVIHK